MWSTGPAEVRVQGSRGRAFLAGFAALLGLAAAGCDGGLAPPDVAGAYIATTLLVTPVGGTQVDALAAGGELRITLDDDGTTSGLLRVPAAGTGGAPFQADLSGDWTRVEGRWVLLDLDQQSFLQNRTFQIGDDVLTSRSTGIDIVLTRE